MSYRKINVDGKTYLYTIGAKHIKIRGVGLFLVSEHGNPLFYPRYRTGEAEESSKKIVSPATIRALIKGEPTPVEVAPNEHRLMRCPYQAEVRHRTEYVPFSIKAFENSYENA